MAEIFESHLLHYSRHMSVLLQHSITLSLAQSLVDVGSMCGVVGQCWKYKKSYLNIGSCLNVLESCPELAVRCMLPITQALSYFLW